MANGQVESLSQKIVICASELASAVGRHRYVPREETFRKVWLRCHRESFCYAYARLFKKEVCSILANCIDLTKQFPNLTEETENADFVPALKLVIYDPQWRSLYREIRNFLKVQTSRDAKEQHLLASAKILEHLGPEVKALCEDETKPVENVVKEICTKARVDKKEIIEAMESKITKDRGTQLESRAVKDFGTSTGIGIIDSQLVPKLFCREMEYNGTKWSVRGKVDAETEDTVIEVKNRINRFMCPEYDYIQLQTYLFICKKSKGILLERLRGENKETSFGFDEELWQEITVELADFVMELSSTIATTKQALYGQTFSRKRLHEDQIKTATEKSGSQGTEIVPEKKSLVDVETLRTDDHEIITAEEVPSAC